MPKLEVTRSERRNYPTYKTANRIVNGDMTAPVEFLGWTALRSLIMVPGLAIVGIRGKKLFAAALAGSTFVSLFALYRTYTTKNMEEFKMRGSRGRARGRKRSSRVRRRS